MDGLTRSPDQSAQSPPASRQPIGMCSLSFTTAPTTGQAEPRLCLRSTAFRTCSGAHTDRGSAIWALGKVWILRRRGGVARTWLAQELPVYLRKARENTQHNLAARVAMELESQRSITPRRQDSQEFETVLGGCP